MARHLDLWRGFQVEYPDGWRVLFPPVDGVAFDAPDGAAFLELSLHAALPPHEALTARLGRFPPHEARAFEGGVLFHQEQCSGQLRAQATPSGSLVALAQARRGTDFDLTAHLQRLLGSLCATAPTPRHPWLEPGQGCLRLLCPEGWQPRAGVMQTGTGPTPMARVTLNPRTWAATEPQLHLFHQPFRGLRPLFEFDLAPMWQQSGQTVLGYEDYGQPYAAEARLRQSDGSLRVVGLQAAVLPGMAQWVGGPATCYQTDDPERWEPVLRGIIESTKIEPAWRSRQNAAFQQQMAWQSQQSQQWMQLSQNLHNQRMHDIQMQGLNNTLIHQQRQEIADMQVQGFQQTSHLQDQMHHDTINSIREHRDFIHPVDGTVYNLPAGFERVWTDGHDHFLGGGWNLEPPPEWQELRPFRPS